jgi:putative FmdB family regulatory protein
MPTYDYACSDCGGFDAFRPLAERNDACACPACGTAAQRVFVSTPWLACTTPEQRRAHETNERAQHVPRSSRDTEGSYARMRHPSGCGCCTTSSRRSSTVTAPNGAKTFPSKRPWMISH